MADNSWKGLELWERVKWARSRRFDSATAAAIALGMEPGTYRCYERGPDTAKFISLDYKHAIPFARAFKVRWEWLLDGLGVPWLTPPDDDEPERSEDQPPNHLRAWREYRNLTVEALARKSNLGVETIKAVESGQAKFSEKLMDAVAKPLDASRGWLRDYDPNDFDPTFLETWRSVPKERRTQALEILKTFRRSAKEK
jgi:transcriptional regulator with XRE-family HTH domain